MDLDLNAVSDLISQGLSHQVTQFTIAFGIAAWIHSGRVKKEIASQVTSITGAIDRMASAHVAEATNTSTKIDQLTSRVDALEKGKK
jgi:hypothetical protein